MQILINLRWVFLIVAFACALAWVVSYVAPAYGSLIPYDVTIYLAAPLQTLGVYAMRRAGKRGWPVVVGYGAVVFWLIALAAAFAAFQAGTGGAVYGIIFMLPAIGIAGVLQLAALIGFARR